MPIDYSDNFIVFKLWNYAKPNYTFYQLDIHSVP